MKHKIKLATNLGFCGGVKRAVKLAEQQAEKNQRTYTLGPLVHNPQVVESFEKKGISLIEKPSEADPGSVVIIRAHGVEPSIYKELEACGHYIIDGTCGKVSASQSIIRDYDSRGYQIIIVGDPGHGEVLGLRGQADNPIVISCKEEADQIQLQPRCMLISQTTFKNDRFEEVAQTLREKNPDIIIKNRICPATEKRQTALKQLIPDVDALIVLGGHGSANTQRLFQIAQSSGKPCWQVETPEELDLSSLEDFPVIGITAGASTPHYIIEKTKNLLEDF